MDFVSLLGTTWHRNPPGSALQLAHAEQATGRRLPDDYREMMLWSNGGEGRVGQSYLSLWSVGELATLNASYSIARWLPQVLAIGSDGGDECFGIEFAGERGGPVGYIWVPFGDLSRESIRTAGRTLAESVAVLKAATPE